MRLGQLTIGEVARTVLDQAARARRTVVARREARGATSIPIPADGPMAGAHQWVGYWRRQMLVGMRCEACKRAPIEVLNVDGSIAPCDRRPRCR